MPYRKYNISDYTTTMDIVITDKINSHKERKRFGGFWSDLKSTIFKWHYYNGYFEPDLMSPSDEKAIALGCSPCVKTKNADDRTIFSLHHIQPLNCGGKTVPSNLIPLPQKFHEFIHNKIISPQIDNLSIGDKKTLIGMPDFTKISLRQMMDPYFRIQYHKYVVDNCGIVPPTFQKVGKKKHFDREYFNNWYKRTFSVLEKQ